MQQNTNSIDVDAEATFNKADAHKIFLVIAPSGAGKSSLVAKLLEAHPNVRLSISYTTRQARPGEVNGMHYHFVTPDVFLEMQKNDAFAEWAQVHDHHYGTSKIWLEQALQTQHVLLEIDWQGAQQICQHFNNTVQIFILPPSFAILKQRLIQRGTDSPTTIERRLQNAKKEMAYAPHADYMLVNDDFSQALAQLNAIIQGTQVAQKCLTSLQMPKYVEIFSQF